MSEGRRSIVIVDDAESNIDILVDALAHDYDLFVAMGHLRLWQTPSPLIYGAARNLPIRHHRKFLYLANLLTRPCLKI